MVSIMDSNHENTSTTNLARTGSVKYTDKTDFESPPKNSKKKFDISEQGGLLFVVVIVGALLLIGVERLISHGSRFFTSSSNTVVKQEEKQEPGIEQEEERPGGLYLAKTLGQAQDSIREEIAVIRQENGLPEQVFQRNIPPDENVGALLTKEISLFDQNACDRLRDSISAYGPWHVDKEMLQTQAAILTAFKPQRDRLRELLENPDAQFEQDFLGTNLGLVPDDQNIDYAWSYLTLEECEVARCLQEGDMDGAVEALKSMLRFTELAAQTQFAEMRIHTAYMRENVLRILQTLALDPKFMPKHADTIFRMLHQTLTDWPSDAKCWIGDRASGLKLFELIRQGRIGEALTDDDLEELRRFDVLGFETPRENKQITLLDRVAFYKPQSCDKDQDYYLKAMRTLIDSCSQQFYARLQTLNRISDDLQSQQGKKDYPAISRLLLRGIRESMQKQAMDKARVEAWYLALATSLKLTVKEGAVDPVRGQPYVITRNRTPEGNRIIVTYSGDEKVEVKE